MARAPTAAATPGEAQAGPARAGSRAGRPRGPIIHSLTPQGLLLFFFFSTQLAKAGQTKHRAAGGMWQGRWPWGASPEKAAGEGGGGPLGGPSASGPCPRGDGAGPLGAAAAAGAGEGCGGCPAATGPDGGPAAPAAGLSGRRAVSSIPMGAAPGPAHQPSKEGGTGAGGNWVYPSEDQFFRAMRRKGWDPAKEDMPSVVAIHNTVNERAWQEILRWEALHPGCPPKLLKFQGKPREFSPRARLLNWMGYKLPFDRHDWVVERCGQEVRYVIDFYNAAPAPGAPVAMHLDVRPALDSFQAVLDRSTMTIRQACLLATGALPEGGASPAAPGPAVAAELRK